MSIFSIVERDLFDIYENFPDRQHSRLNSIESEIRNWFNETEWADSKRAAKLVARHQMGTLAARAYPDEADPLTSAKLLAWLTVFDDIIESNGSDNTALIEGLLGPLIDGHPPELWRSSPIANILAGLWPALTYQRSLCWQRRLRTHIADYVHVEQNWAENRAAHQTPSLSVYIAGRRRDGNFTIGMDLIERELNLTIPDAVFHGEAFQKLWIAAMDIMTWTNDLLSADKEMSAGCVINLIVVLQSEFKFSRTAAGEQAVEMIGERVQDFFEVANTWQSDSFTESDLATVVSPWIKGVQCTIRGLYEWSTRTERY